MPNNAITALAVNNVGGKIQGRSGVEVCRYKWGSGATLGSPLAAPSQVPTGDCPSLFAQKVPRERSVGQGVSKGSGDHSPHVATLTDTCRITAVHPCIPERYGMGGCVQRHAHVGAKRTGRGLRQNWCGSKGNPSTEWRYSNRGCLDGSWERDTNEGLRETQGGSWPGILRVELSGLWGAGGLEQGVGSLFGITSACRGRAQLCLVVLLSLTRWHPAVTRVSLSMGAPRGWGHPRVEAVASEKLCGGDHRVLGPGGGAVG